MNSNSATLTLSSRFTRQISLPSLAQGIAESLLFGGVFLAAGYISLGSSISDMLGSVVPFVGIMMCCMVASGVYRADISTSIARLYAHSMYGFLLALFALVVVVASVLPEYGDRKFVFFFLFFGFFVINTVRPLLSGTDFMDGGGRRIN